MEKILNRARAAVGRGETLDPQTALARKRTKAEMDLSKFLKKEELLKVQQSFYREKAKDALKEGNTREYELNNAQFKRASGGLKMASAAVDASRNMIGLMDSQESMGSIVDMSKTVAEMQEALGIDPAVMEDAVMNIRESMATTDAVSNSMSSISDMVTGGDSLEMGDPLKAELMAEIQAESAVNGFGEKIKAEMKELEE